MFFAYIFISRLHVQCCSAFLIIHFKTQGERSPWIALSYHSLPRHSGILKYMYLYRSTSLENYMSWEMLCSLFSLLEPTGQAKSAYFAITLHFLCFSKRKRSIIIFPCNGFFKDINKQDCKHSISTSNRT